VKCHPGPKADGKIAGDHGHDSYHRHDRYVRRPSQVPDQQAVLHAHPRHAIALSLVMDVIEPADAEGKLRLGAVPVVEAEDVAQALRDAPIVMARGHGSYARGGDLWQALQWTSVLEESAQVLWLLRALRR